MRGDVERLRSILLNQWAEAHYYICQCDEPDAAGCEWPVPIPCSATELRDALAAVGDSE